MSVDTIKERFRRMTDREKIMFIALVSVLCVTVATVAFALVKKKSGELKATIEGNERILDEIKSKKEELSSQIMKKQQEEERFEKAPLHLLGLIGKLAGKAGIEIPESRDMPDETISKKWIHKSVEIRLRKIGLDTLVKFMVNIKNENRKFPIAVTKMNIKKRSGEPNSFDIQMTVSTYTNKTKKKKPKSKKKEKKAKPPLPEPKEFTTES